MDIKILNALMAKVMNKELMDKSLEEVSALVMDGEIRTTVVYKDNVYEFVVLDTDMLVHSLGIKLNKNGVSSSVYIDEDCIKDFKHINTLSELLDDIYKDWETKVNSLSSDEHAVDKFIDVNI